MTNNLNLNIAECLIPTRDIGGTIVHNICSGSSSAVPWGSAEWLGFYVTIGLGGVALAFLAGVIGFIAFDTIRHY